MEEGMKRKGVYLGEIDEECIKAIRAKYGLCSDNDAIRLALRLLADEEAIKVTVAPKTAKKALRSL